jgi:hypothetical protein
MLQIGERIERTGSQAFATQEDYRLRLRRRYWDGGPPRRRKPPGPGRVGGASGGTAGWT